MDTVIPFSDRLVEYLLQAVITSQEAIDNNILSKKTISSYEHEKTNNTRYTAEFVPGVWDNNMRNYLYNLAIKVLH